jgi:phasin
LRKGRKPPPYPVGDVFPNDQAPIFTTTARARIMNAPKFEVPAEIRNMTEKTIDQAEKAFNAFFEVANKSMVPSALPGAELSKKMLSLTEQNMRAAFDAARKVAATTDLQEAMKIQSEFLKGQFENTRDQMKQIAEGFASTVKDMTDGQSKTAN